MIGRVYAKGQQTFHSTLAGGGFRGSHTAAQTTPNSHAHTQLIDHERKLASFAFDGGMYVRVDEETTESMNVRSVQEILDTIASHVGKTEDRQPLRRHTAEIPLYMLYLLYITASQRALIRPVSDEELR